jgi:hypothetical protein
MNLDPPISTRRPHDQVSMAYCLEGFAGAAALEGHLEKAAGLFGGAAKLRSVIGAPRNDGEQAAPFYRRAFEAIFEEEK